MNNIYTEFASWFSLTTTFFKNYVILKILYFKPSPLLLQRMQLFRSTFQKSSLSSLIRRW